MIDSPSFLPYGRQWIDESDIAAVAEVLRSDRLTTGPAVDAFEHAFARKVGAPYAVACANGTAALHLAALALGLGPGDHVIVPTITFLATANAARLVGAEVIFTDVDPDTGLMRPDDLVRALEGNRDKRIRAVFPVHLAGRTADPEAVATIAREAGLSVVEDACHALGTTYAAGSEIVQVGSCGHADMATFSFHPVKTIACGEGGMVTTCDAALAARIVSLRSHGMTREAESMANADLAFAADGTLNPWYYEAPEIGFNYRLSDVHCALGLSQLGKLDRFAELRRAHTHRYDRALAQLAPTVVPVRSAEGVNPVLHLYQVLVDFEGLGTTRAALMKALAGRGVATQVHYIPVHRQPYYRRRDGELDLPGADRFYARCLTLPLFPAMTDEDVDRVVEGLVDCRGNTA